jgi:hypothetical protein
VLVDDGAQPLVDLAERLVPRDIDVAGRGAPLRCSQTVGILVQVLERRALRTDEPAREHVLAVAADAHDLPVGDGDLEAARRLAQRTGAEVDGVGHRAAR